MPLLRVQVVACVLVNFAVQSLLVLESESFVTKTKQVLATTRRVGKELASIVERMEQAGPDRGLHLLWCQTRSGYVTQEEFIACIQRLVFLSLLDIEDREDELAAYDALLLMTNLPSC